MMVLHVILIIFQNVILKTDLIVQPGMELIWLLLHIVFPWIILIVSQTQEIFVIIQVMHQLGVIFKMKPILAKRLMDRHVTILGRDYI